MAQNDVRGTHQAHQLTNRQFQVLVLLAEGLIAQEIAKELEIAECTVRSHIKAIRNKLDASSDAAAVNIAWQWDVFTFLR